MARDLEIDLAIAAALQRLALTAADEDAVQLRRMADAAERDRPGVNEMAMRYHRTCAVEALGGYSIH